MDDDDGFAFSDAEIDSEIEDTDMDGELGIWLDQLNSYTQEDPLAGIPGPPHKPPTPRDKPTLNPKLVMDSFRSSFMAEGQDLDLDAILGELCQLETTLTTQQTEISTSMKNAGIASPATSPTSDAKPPPSKNRDSLAELQSALDDDLHSALSELSDLVGINFNDPANNSSAPTKSAGHVTADVAVTDDLPKVNGATLSGYHDYSPDGADADSAFSDSSSLPSSGSHVSVTTTSSQQSNGSGGSCGSSGVGMNNATADRMYGILEMDSIKDHLKSYQKSLEKLNLPLAEQAAKLKAEKIRIALEKIKEANIQKLFVRFYSEDNCSKSILVDEKTTVVQTCERLVVKNNVTPSENWAVVEHLPELYMERLLEDHELVMESLMMWTRDSNNRLLFVQSPGKYHVFQQPEVYLTSDKKEDLNDAGREALIEEYFTGENIRFPEIEGQLFLKSEGKKAWKKFFFVLRASGLYYSPKGKGKTSKDLVCLQKLDMVDVYTAVSWKKKYKAPTEFGFALKHAQIQKKTPKYIKYLCAEDQKTFSTWVTGIRIAKFGNKLYENFKAAKSNFSSLGSKDILPNQNFLDYLTKQNERNQEFAKEHHLQPRKSICPLSTQTMGDISEHDGDSLASSDSGNKRMSSVSKMSYASDESPRKSSFPTIGNGSCRRGSFPVIDRRPSNQSIDYNQNQDYRSSDEDIRTPTKKVPNLPVTTQTTKLLTDQNAASGTLKRRPSHGGTIKKRPPLNVEERFNPERRGSGGMDLDMDDFPLPPPPPELLNPPPENGLDQVESAYSVVNVATKPPIVGGSLPNSPQKRPPVYAKPQIGKVQAAQVSVSAPQSPAHKPVYGTPQGGNNGMQHLGRNSQLGSPQHGPSPPQLPQGSPQRMQSPPPTPPHGTPQHRTSQHGSPQYQYGLPQQPPPPPPPQQPQYGTPTQSPYGTPHGTPQRMSHNRNSSMPGPQLPPLPPHQNSPIHRRGSSNPANIEQPIYQTPKGRPPPPPPKRSENTKLSIYAESPQAEYFISDLSRVLHQKREWSQGLQMAPSMFPPEPPPGMTRVHNPQAPVMDEWLPPPPADLLEGLQQARRNSRSGPPVQKKTFVTRGQH